MKHYQTASLNPVDGWFCIATHVIAFFKLVVCDHILPPLEFDLGIAVTHAQLYAITKQISTLN